MRNDAFWQQKVIPSCEKLVLSISFVNENETSVLASWHLYIIDPDELKETSFSIHRKHLSVQLSVVYKGKSMLRSTVTVLSFDHTLVRNLSDALGTGYHVDQTEIMDNFLEQVDDLCPYYAVLDFRIPSRGGHREDRLIHDLTTRFPDVKLALLTTEPCPETLERRIVMGGIKRFKEPVNMQELIRELQIQQPAATPTDYESETNNKDNPMMTLKGITRRFETYTPKFRRMLADLETAASHDVTILLIGETGAGKTFLSQLIHEVSPRRNDPFLPIACGALPSELIESEMFGHVKGSFTSAHADKEGKFVAAGRGTILLDEIDVLEPEQQVKLLRVIETGQFEPVGSNRTLTSQARLVVASNLSLEPLVQRGKFRPDLYYRLNMLKFEIPPLRKRRPDIVPLTRKFVNQLARKHNINIEAIDDQFLLRLLEYPWPGNVRELENVIQRAVIYCRDGVLKESHLPPHVLAGNYGPTNDPSVRLMAQPGNARQLDHQIAMTEQEIIEQALLNNNNSRTRAAKELGISRVTLYNKIKKYGIHLPK